ncbi:MAG TPA: biotin/lipoyl-containing protein [Chthonomonadaceae bacterium]|nr:biotin/lipoyl-containing protein [Chthonomonadaceae bacterium]
MPETRYDTDGGEVAIGVERSADGWRVRLPDGRDLGARVVRRAGPLVEIAVDPAAPGVPEARFAAAVVRAGSSIIVSYRGRVYRFQQPTRRPEGGPAASGGVIKAPCGGIVADLVVAEGQIVDAGDPVAVIEAMKVMTPVDAPMAGAVRGLRAERGQRVEPGEELARIEARV